jgi:hypothetical protein
MPGSYTTLLGTNDDYIMYSSWSTFDSFTEQDLAGLMEDLEHLRTEHNHLTNEQYQKACSRYSSVIIYVEDQIAQRLLAEIALVKSILSSQDYGVITKPNNPPTIPRKNT